MKGILIASWVILGLAALGWLTDPQNASIYGWLYAGFVALITAKAWTQMERVKELEAHNEKLIERLDEQARVKA